MIGKILLNGQEFHFTKSHLPLLIHGEEKVGGSLFTMTIVADLYSQGNRLIALTGFPMAKEEFVKQSGMLDNAKFFTKENKDKFIDLISKTTEADNYVILIKNIELFTEEIFELVKGFNNIIISGDLSNCVFKEEVLQKTFNTRIYFSALDKQIPNLKKYQGYIISKNETGTVWME